MFILFSHVKSILMCIFNLPRKRSQLLWQQKMSDTTESQTWQRGMSVTTESQTSRQRTSVTTESQTWPRGMPVTTEPQTRQQRTSVGNQPRISPQLSLEDAFKQAMTQYQAVIR